MLKNRINQIIIGVVVLVILLVAGILFFTKKDNSTSITAKVNTQTDTSVHELPADDIGLDFAATPDNKKVQITIAKPDGIKAVTYEITYEANSTAEEKSEGGDARIQRGITGDAKITSGATKYQSPWLDLGSCSKNVCRYDQGVTSVDLLLKITKSDNKIYSTEKTLQL